MDNWGERMKVKELMKLLEGVSPDAEITCNMTTEAPTQLLGMTCAEFEALKNHEIFCILEIEDREKHEESCKFLM